MPSMCKLINILIWLHHSLSAHLKNASIVKKFLNEGSFIVEVIDVVVFELVEIGLFLSVEDLLLEGYEAVLVGLTDVVVFGLLV